MENNRTVRDWISWLPEPFGSSIIEGLKGGMINLDCKLTFLSPEILEELLDRMYIYVREVKNINL